MQLNWGLDDAFFQAQLPSLPLPSPAQDRLYPIKGPSYGWVGECRGPWDEGQMARFLVSTLSVIFWGSSYKASWQIPDLGFCALDNLYDQKQVCFLGKVPGHWCQLNLYP